jgi:tripartite-type tricarboxylate transporter receptor subunit TctC
MAGFGSIAVEAHQNVEFVIPFAVGGGADLLARIMHKIMVEEKLVQTPVVLNNRPGGGGAAGIGYVSASRRADPHTIIIVNGTTQITPILNPSAKTISEVRPVMNVSWTISSSSYGTTCHGRPHRTSSRMPRPSPAKP